MSNLLSIFVIEKSVLEFQSDSARSFEVDEPDSHVKFGRGNTSTSFYVLANDACKLQILTAPNVPKNSGGKIHAEHPQAFQNRELQIEHANICKSEHQSGL